MQHGAVPEDDIARRCVSGRRGCCCSGSCHPNYSERRSSTSTLIFSPFLFYLHTFSRRQDDFADGLPEDWNGINRLRCVFPLLRDDPVLRQSPPGDRKYPVCCWTRLCHRAGEDLPLLLPEAQDEGHQFLPGRRVRGADRLAHYRSCAGDLWLFPPFQGFLPSCSRLYQKNTCPWLNPQPALHQCICGQSG